ncbi:hypothetical protein FACS189487_08720 [Campylobacterota bacterium]|nr:hypothetical protein FACS189487_08720 [Campylobacterota bacterium]
MNPPKLFDEWNTVKKAIQDRKTLHFKEREIFFIAVGVNVGHEIDGKGDKSLHPVLVFKKINNHLFFGIPLTSTIREGDAYFSFEFKQGKTSCAMLSQLRVFSTKRVEYRSGWMSINDFEVLFKKLESYIIPTRFTPPAEARRVVPKECERVL